MRGFREELIQAIFSLSIAVFLFFSSLASSLDDSSRLLSSFRVAIAAGEKQMEEGDYQKAIERLELALKLSQELKIKNDEVHVLRQLGLLNWNIGRLDISSSFYKKALDIAQSSGLKDDEQKCNVSLEIYKQYLSGKDCRVSGQFEQSIKYFIGAIRLARKIKSPNHEIKCLRQMSLNYWEMNNIDEFFKLNTQAQQLASMVKNRKEEGICFNNIGLYYWKFNEYSKALKYFQLSLEIAEKENILENISDSLANISLIYSDLGDYDRALDYSQRVLIIDQELKNDYDIAINLNNIGNYYLNKGIQTQSNKYWLNAIESYNGSLKLAQKIQNKKIASIIFNNIGEVFFAQKKFDLALKSYGQALKNANESSYLELISLLHNNIGNIYLKLELNKEAINYFTTAIDLALKNNNGKILWEAYYGLGQCFEKTDESSRALEYYLKSLEIIDKIRGQIHLDTFKTGYVRNKSKVYESLINLLWRRRNKGEDESQEEKMFHFIEKAKARAFFECLTESKIDIQKKLNPEQREELNKVASRISSLYFEMTKTENAVRNKQDLKEKLSQEEDNYIRLISKMRTENPALASLMSPEPYPLEKLQTQILDDRTAVVEYYLGEQRSFVLFITKNDFGIFPLPPRQQIENSIKAYLKYLSFPPRDEFNGKIAATRIFKELFFPLEDQKYRSIEKLILIPDGILYYLPFETLTSPRIEPASAYLIDRYRVSYAPSSSILMFLCDKRENQEFYKGLLAFGDPKYQNETHSTGGSTNGENVLAEIYLSQGFAFSSIPYSRNEIKAVSKYFPTNQRSVYLGKAAREDVIKAGPHGNYQIIHFACHGFLDELQPIRSALVLTQGRKNAEDGFLQVRELYNLRLNANLVILSACETGKGTLEKGEGILGLPRIFFYSGARSVLSTLWSVNDKSTAFFMKRFYRYLAEGFSKAQALRLAKQEMIRSKYAHPYYWAGFVLNGEPDSRIDFH